VIVLVEAHLDWVFAHPHEARFMYQATAMELSPSASGALQARKAELLAPVVAHFARFIDEGSLRAGRRSRSTWCCSGRAMRPAGRLLAGAPLEEAWMKSTLPRLAWGSVKRERNGVAAG
jgi:hypothetical protein